MITVIVDRDTTDAGDHASTHVTTWTFDDDARVGDVIIRCIEDYLPELPHVGWRISLLRAARVRRALGEPVGIYPGEGGGDRPIALVFTGDHPEQPQLMRMDAYLNARTHLAQSGMRTPTGEYHIFAGFVSHVGPMEFSDFRRWVDESDDEEQDRLGAELHAKYPDLFDEHGDPRMSGPEFRTG